MTKEISKTRRPVGRPKIQIDYALVDELMNIQCTGEEIAAVLHISYDSLAKRIEEDHGMNFTEYYEAKKGEGKASLRRRQWLSAMQGNPVMQIFLGKNMLGQVDKPEEQPQTNVNILNLSNLSLAELQKLAAGEAIED